MKTVEEIYEEMMDTYALHTGLRPSVGCDLSVRLYAVASQIFALYSQSDWVLRQCFPQTAYGSYLDNHGTMRGLSRKDASTATGYLRFSTSQANSQDMEIPAGTVAMTAGLVRFQTVETGVLPAGENWVDVRAEAVEPGAGGNIGSGMIISMAVPPVGVAACSNPSEFVNGTDAEEDEGLRSRILETYKRLPNGANAAFYLQEALSFERVTSATVIPRSRGIGTVDVVIATSSGLPEEDLLLEVLAHLQERREIAVDVEVLAPSLRTLNLSLDVTAGDDYTQEEAVAETKEAIEAWFDGTRLGCTLMEAELGNRVYQCKSVANYQINTNLKDYTIETDELPILGTLTVGDLL